VVRSEGIGFAAKTADEGSTPRYGSDVSPGIVKSAALPVVVSHFLQAVGSKISQ
jgi:hypothetical protein